ncbi:hypothetical protein CIT292_08394 [Citrobacter youngae ATCC 29220]|uniref:Uncharacterized protein n=1 Tax=Citrobacter youngae ATCC 29220 TaxID=500640 RepID=D4BD27_9ENTR|nr:hypothetical protein CIT292_08394 [Citrobacter youngae ATCC 29220]
MCCPFYDIVETINGLFAINRRVKLVNFIRLDEKIRKALIFVAKV